MTSDAASVTFSNIPQTYTNLLVKWVTRGTVSQNAYYIYTALNGTAGSTTYGYSSGSAAVGDRSTGYMYVVYTSAGYATTNTFGTGEFTIHNYTGSSAKPITSWSAPETNSATSQAAFWGAGLWNNAAAVTSVLVGASSGNLVAGSSVYLYGIKHA